MKILHQLWTITTPVLQAPHPPTPHPPTPPPTPPPPPPPPHPTPHPTPPPHTPTHPHPSTHTPLNALVTSMSMPVPFGNCLDIFMSHTEVYLTFGCTNYEYYLNINDDIWISTIIHSSTFALGSTRWFHHPDCYTKVILKLSSSLTGFIKACSYIRRFTDLTRSTRCFIQI